MYILRTKRIVYEEITREKVDDDDGVGGQRKEKERETEAERISTFTDFSVFYSCMYIGYDSSSYKNGFHLLSWISSLFLFCAICCSMFVLFRGQTLNLL